MLLSNCVRSQDMESVGELYHRYTPLIYGVCLKYLRDTEAAKDAVIRILMEVESKIDRYQVTTFCTWGYSVTKNHGLTLLLRVSNEVDVDFSEIQSI